VDALEEAGRPDEAADAAAVALDLAQKANNSTLIAPIRKRLAELRKKGA
jgi:hypothetical protein